MLSPSMAILGNVQIIPSRQCTHGVSLLLLLVDGRPAIVFYADDSLTRTSEYPRRKQIRIEWEQDVSGGFLAETDLDPDRKASRENSPHSRHVVRREVIWGQQLTSAIQFTYIQVLP